MSSTGSLRKNCSIPIAVVSLLLGGCSKGAAADLQYVKEARSLAAEWALVNEQAKQGNLTATYVDSMHQWLHRNLQSAAASLTTPNSPYGNEMKALLAEAPDASPGRLRMHATRLKQIEKRLESA
jgi:hypothetical protein